MQIDTPCLDCGLPIRVEIRDGKILRAEPEGLMAYVTVPFWKWFENAPLCLKYDEPLSVRRTYSELGTV
ncbi:MAG: hypothetical protein HXY44_07595 [Syntrophaceae bacterium]|nr:hypothetical protein [Syntrophaceae bacterium]